MNRQHKIPNFGSVRNQTETHEPALAMPISSIKISFPIYTKHTYTTHTHTHSYTHAPLYRPPSIQLSAGRDSVRRIDFRLRGDGTVSRVRAVVRAARGRQRHTELQLRAVNYLRRRTVCVYRALAAIPYVDVAVYNGSAGRATSL